MPHFNVHLDYGTSEHAGAGGLFQVFSITDDDGKDRTHLVDQGTHYADLEELKSSIAKRLDITTKEISLTEV
ncbi:hypothetical protein HRD49_38015 [Corallococcus exiguus]|uniref:hypothetical protein n=1 Tax=Corallococcus exiguus TaxID=83462 RepID=UPI0015611914|nr:hypothetical protein [Corallococcus exiguus]NRD67546.1 hypothetical protein [Corallococcus exiguus]